MLTRTSARTGHRGAIYDLAPSPEGFFTAASDGFIVHWHREDVDFGTVVARVEDGKFLCMTTLGGGGFVAGALDGGVHWLYPEAPDQNLHVAHHRRGVFDVLRVGDAVYTAGGDGVLTRWDAQTGRTDESLPLSPNSLRCLAYWEYDGGHLIVGASDGNVYLVPLDFGEIARFPANQPSVFAVAPLPSQAPARFVTGGRDAQLLFHSPGALSVPAPTVIPAHNSTINDLAFSPNGHYLATASRDKTVKLWDSATWELLKVAEVVRDSGHVNSVNTLLWLDDETLVTAGDDRRVLEWRVG